MMTSIDEEVTSHIRSAETADLDSQNLIMRKIVQEVDGHRVVIMEVGNGSF